MNEVRNTKIYADRRPDGRQLIVYEMTFDAREDAVAMVLPIPVAANAGDDAVEFIDLTKEPEFFDRLWRSFDGQVAPSGGAVPLGASRSLPPLAVHQVGVFEASFVPTRADFTRLDPRFRLTDRVLDALGKRAERGFVVVKLGAGKGALVMHPLAFTFPSSDPTKVFYPTVHVHDGDVHADAEYDHALYGQDLGGAVALGAWWGLEDAGIPALRVPGAFPVQARWHEAETRTVIGKHPGGWLLARGTRVFRAELVGRRKNDDTWVGLGAAPTEREIVAAFATAVNGGGNPRPIVAVLRSVPARRLGLFERLTNGLALREPPPIAVVAIEPTRASLPGVFRVHAENADLRSQSHIFGAGSVLCALDAPGQVVALDSPAAVAAWAGGRAMSAADRAWLDGNAR